MDILTLIHLLFFVVKSFLELVPYLLSLPGAPEFLSRRITQDSLEKFFGLQHQRRRVNDNPSAQEFCKNSEAIRVIQTSMATVKGNCRGCEMEDNADVPIKRRKS